MEVSFGNPLTTPYISQRGPAEHREKGHDHKPGSRVADCPANRADLGSLRIAKHVRSAAGAISAAASAARAIAGGAEIRRGWRHAVPGRRIPAQPSGPSRTGDQYRPEIAGSAECQNRRLRVYR